MLVFVVAMLKSNLQTIAKQSIYMPFTKRLKKTLSNLARLAHLRVFIWKNFLSPRWDPGKILWDPAGWITSHMLLQGLFKEGEISPRWASPPNRTSSSPYEQPLKSADFSKLWKISYMPSNTFLHLSKHFINKSESLKILCWA